MIRPSRPRRPTSSSSRTIRVNLQLRSQNPNRPSPLALRTLDASKKELIDSLEPKYGSVRLSLERRKTLPIDPGTVLVTIIVTVSTAAAAGFGDELGKDVYSWVKKRLRGTSVTKEARPKKKK